MKRMLVWLLSLAIFCALVPSAMADSWTCPDCGKKNSGDYCGECGRYVHANVEREINLVRSEDWFCLNCGNISTDKFCSSCGCKRSEGMEGSFVRYGAYEQDDNIRNGDEDIEWVVVSEESDSLTLLSLYLLDAQSFDDSQSTNRWSDSSLRVWLHISFLPKAFSETELRYFLQNESDLVSLMPRGMANSALIQREARIAEATTSARNRAEGWIDSNCWFLIDGGNCGYVDGEQGNLGSFCSGGEKQTMYVRPMIVIRNIPAMEEQYQQGLALLESEEYEEALKIFEGIRIHKDSAEKIKLLENLITEKQYQYGLALLENEEYDKALKIFESIRAYKDSAQKIEDCESAILEEKYNAAVALMEAGQYEEAITAFQALDGHKDSAEQIVHCKKAIEDEALAKAEELLLVGDFDGAMAIYESLSNVEGIKQAENLKLEAAYQAAKALAKNDKNAEAAIAFGKLGEYKDSKERSFDLWKSVAIRETISAGFQNIMGLQSNGIVVAVGANEYGECELSNWSDIIAVSSGSYYSLGLHSDGTVSAKGREDKFSVADWSNIVAINAGNNYPVGVKSDGTVVCSESISEITQWNNIVAASAGWYHIVGLKVDGTVVAAGENKYGECNVSSWKDVVSVSAGLWLTVGLQSDGTVLATGYNGDKDNIIDTLATWSDIISISVKGSNVVGLKADGTVLAVGDNIVGQCYVSNWSNIVAISAGVLFTAGLKEDGTVVAVGSGINNLKCDVSAWKNIKLPN